MEARSYHTHSLIRLCSSIKTECMARGRGFAPPLHPSGLYPVPAHQLEVKLRVEISCGTKTGVDLSLPLFLSMNIKYGIFEHTKKG